MLGVKGRKPAAVVIEPIARTLLRARISPNMVTIVGALCASIVAVALIPQGHLVWAALLTALSTATDMIDGTMARLRGGGTKFGATLDATCDRITDGALFVAITWWLVYSYDAPGILVASALVVTVSSQVISYVKARGEASGFTINGGLVERPERLIVGLLGIGLHGLGVPYAVDIAIYLLAIGSAFTVIQRLIIASRDPHACDAIKPPAGAPDSQQLQPERTA